MRKYVYVLAIFFPFITLLLTLNRSLKQGNDYELTWYIPKDHLQGDVDYKECFINFDIVVFSTFSPNRILNTNWEEIEPHVFFSKKLNHFAYVHEDKDNGMLITIFSKSSLSSLMLERFVVRTSQCITNG